MPYDIKVNGVIRTVDVDGDTPVLWVLRDVLGMTGTKFGEAPIVQVHIVQSAESPGGMGEPGTAAVAPAITNATFAATDKRLRRLPIDPAQLRST